jgi:hypothetical protein
MGREILLGRPLDQIQPLVPSSSWLSQLQGRVV